jgi:hypothetical protein
LPADRDDLVLLLLKRLFDLREGGHAANRSLQLCDVGSVYLQAREIMLLSDLDKRNKMRCLPLSERVCKVAGVEYERMLSGLDQIRSDLIPAERTRAGDQERLSRGCIQDLTIMRLVRELRDRPGRKRRTGAFAGSRRRPE